MSNQRTHSCVNTMSEPACYYHPNRRAVEKCERCHRLICLQDKNVYRQRHSRGTGNHRSYYYSERIYCTPCYLDVQREGYQAVQRFSPLVFVCVLPFALGGLLMSFFALSWIEGASQSGAPSSFSSFGYIFVVFGLLFGLGVPSAIVYTTLKTSKQAPIKIEDLEQQKKQFYGNLPPQTDINPSSIGIGPAKMTCFQCGTNLTPSDLFCPNCGDTTADEREALGG